MIGCGIEWIFIRDKVICLIEKEAGYITRCCWVFLINNYKSISTIFVKELINLNILTNENRSFIMSLPHFIGCNQPEIGNQTQTKLEVATVNVSTTSSVKQFEYSNKQTYANLDSALKEPEKVIYLTGLGDNYRDVKHLPFQIGSLINLKVLEFKCLENLEDLPNEIGLLKNLEKLIIDNGNGCEMNLSIPHTIGQLQNLKELRLYGAIDPRKDLDSISINRMTKKLPNELGNLQNLEVLDLGRNGITSIPTQIKSLKKLKTLKLDYNDIHEVPSFVSELTNLELLDIDGNGHITLPNSLLSFKTLTVNLGNAYLKLKEQKELQKRFPNIIFSFGNDYDDAAANEEAK